jgi:hypothetical protein
MQTKPKTKSVRLSPKAYQVLKRSKKEYKKESYSEGLIKLEEERNYLRKLLLENNIDNAFRY